jgi:hypothetical protein
MLELHIPKSMLLMGRNRLRRFVLPAVTQTKMRQGLARARETGGIFSSLVPPIQLLLSYRGAVRNGCLIPGARRRRVRGGPHRDPHDGLVCASRPFLQRNIGTQQMRAESNRRASGRRPRLLTLATPERNDSSREK